MPDTLGPVAKDVIGNLLVVTPENRLGSQDIEDLCNHDFFFGLNFKTIKDKEPPKSKRIDFTLSKMKKIQMGYLPKYLKN